MRAEERRQAICDILRQSSQPVSATALAARFSVSRQIIVGDIALLRAAGAAVSATPRGYVIQQSQADARPLSDLTEGIHLHTLSCPSEDAFLRVQTALREMEVLLEG